MNSDHRIGATTETNRLPAPADLLPMPRGAATSQHGRECQPHKRGTRLTEVTVIARKYGLIGAWLILIIAFSITNPDTFATTRNATAIMAAQAPLLVLSLALLLPLIVGEFDLSVAGTLGITYVLCPFFVVNHGMSLALAIAICIACGIFVGLVNALVVVRIGVASIVVTLGTGTILYGLAFAILSAPIGGMTNALSSSMSAALGGIEVPFFIAVGLTLACWFVLNRRPLGRMLYLTGMNADAARLAGARVNRVRFGAFILAGILAAVAGLILAGVDGGGDPSTASSLLLPAFATVFLGGAVLTPGRVNAVGTFISTYFLATGVAGLEIMGLTGWVEQVFYGAALVIGVVVAGVRKL